jgi:putative membrane protein
MTTPSDEIPYSEANELAKERNRAAANRTLLAWIRTSLSLITFGFGIDRIVNVISPNRHGSLGLTAAVGLSFMALGIYAIVDASVRYRREIEMLNVPRYMYEERRSSGIVVAIILAVIGALGFVGILVQALLQTRTGS